MLAACASAPALASSAAALDCSSPTEPALESFFAVSAVCPGPFPGCWLPGGPCADVVMPCCCCWCPAGASAGTPGRRSMS